MEDPHTLKKSVKDTYDAIAPSFSKKRTVLWPPMRVFIDEISPCTFGDIGCGAGRALKYAASKGCSVVGIDTSEGQLKMARELLEEEGLEVSAKLILSDMTSIDLPDGSFDNCMMIASLHHLPDPESRVQALNEAYRCTGPGGRSMISVWSWDQERFRKRYLTRIENGRITDGLDGPEPGDVMVPWKDGVERMRFYHLYGPGELESEIHGTPWIMQRSYFDGRNHWAECIKEQL